ncbi:hypothetical protein YK48G_04950 [Lentilactobacillus fungorum]|jgi:hypothetical protein|uniref:Extracellular protein n=1 Tax=Lentilactobacillus fungorum TaxID=2201250 RepID=A0ABQ3VW05_9LACO|nr:hypothetical protein [Lentilactobacillus fungorum]GHP13070.1 hypothetical protein YK48G_04950 [Lentilactobacillus fungorum]
MKKIASFLFAAMIVLGIGLTANPAKAQASASTTTPKALRGTWYEYRGDKKFNVIKITPHSFTYNGKTYSPSKSGYRKLGVSKWGSWYSFNQTKSSTKDLGQYKTKKKLIDGSYKKVLIKYKGVGTYHVFPTSKIYHKYSYSVLD